MAAVGFEPRPLAPESDTLPLSHRAPHGKCVVFKTIKYSTIYVSFYTPMLSDHIFLEDFLLLINVHIIRVNSNQNAST